MDERMQILQMIEDGRISAAEGLRLLEALAGRGPQAEPAAAAEAAPEPASAPAAAAEPAGRHWQNWWLIPMGVGIAILLAGAGLMYWAFQTGGYGFWFFCATLPFALGVLVMAAAAASRTARWLHVRVRTGEKSDGPRNIALSFPLPIGPAAWVLRLIRPYVPKLRETALDELILALGENLSAAAPLYVEVNEGQDGEQVQVYIG